MSNHSTTRSCLHCGQDFYNRPSHNERYCSKQCWIQSINVRAEETFVSKLTRTDSCWIWQGKPHPRSGYGFFVLYGTTMGAHRASWTLFRGEIPDGLFVCHHCDNRLCVNPDHLFLGTHQQNMQDMRAKGRGRNGSRSKPENLPRGEDNKMSKLTEDQVREIRRLYALGGISETSLATEFGVTQSTIGRVVRRECWRHVE